MSQPTRGLAANGSKTGNFTPTPEQQRAIDGLVDFTRSQQAVHLIADQEVQG